MSTARARRAAIVAAALVVSAACVGLASWQLRRLDERRALNARILARRADTPIEIETTAPGAGGAAYRRATARGTYDAEREVLVFGRTLDGRAGHHVVTPLVLADGGAVLILRGWVPFSVRRAPVGQAEPPTAEVTVHGVLVPDQGDGSARPEADRLVRTLDVRGIASALPYEVFPLPLQLMEQVPPQPGSLPVPVTPPEPSEGPHLSYAIQWFSFAGIALIGAAILLRRDRRELRGGP